MSTPTGNDPNYPQGGAPQGQPGWGAPETPAQGYDAPSQSYNAPSQNYNAPPQDYNAPSQGYSPAPSYSGAPAGYGAATDQRPGLVTGAAIVAIVWGGLGTLFGLLAMAVAFSLFPLLGLFVLLAVLISVALLVGGIFALQGKSPKLLLYICYAAIVINLLELIFSIVKSGGSVFSGLLGFIIPGVIIALLFQPASKQWFAARGQTY
jgi:hypothetical protein